MNIQLRGTPDFHFEARNPDNGYSFAIGASESIGGDESGFRPMQILLASLGGCSGIDVVNILKKSRVEFDSIDIEINGDRKPDSIPSPFTHVQLLFRVHGKNVDRSRVEKAVSLSVEKYCSAIASLDPAVKIETITEIVE